MILAIHVCHWQKTQRITKRDGRKCAFSSGKKATAKNSFWTNVSKQKYLNRPRSIYRLKFSRNSESFDNWQNIHLYTAMNPLKLPQMLIY